MKPGGVLKLFSILFAGVFFICVTGGMAEGDTWLEIEHALSGGGIEFDNAIPVAEVSGDLTIGTSSTTTSSFLELYGPTDYVFYEDGIGDVVIKRENGTEIRRSISDIVDIVEYNWPAPLKDVPKGGRKMGDYFAWAFLIIWSVWGLIHWVMRIGLKIHELNGVTLTGGYKYEISDQNKRKFVLFLEGPIVGICALTYCVFKGLFGFIKILVVIPTRGLDKWAKSADDVGPE